MQSVNDLFRLLPGVPLRFVELFRPLLRVVEAAMKGAVGAVHMVPMMLAHVLSRGHFLHRLRERSAERHRHSHNPKNSRDRHDPIFHPTPLA